VGGEGVNGQFPLLTNTNYSDWSSMMSHVASPRPLGRGQVWISRRGQGLNGHGDYALRHAIGHGLLLDIEALCQSYLGSARVIAPRLQPRVHVLGLAC
jgi:hypothetical protein